MSSVINFYKSDVYLLFNINVHVFAQFPLITFVTTLSSFVLLFRKKKKKNLTVHVFVNYATSHYLICFSLKREREMERKRAEERKGEKESFATAKVWPPV